MATRHFIIYADESDKKGKYFSNFFGGVLLKASDRQPISEALEARKVELGINREIKWQYVDASCVDRYIEFVRTYFEFVATSRLKTRIMFTQNMMVPRNLESRHHKEQYFLLYYQFIKHAFGIKYCNPNILDRVYFTILPDKIPDSKEAVERFKDYLSRVPESAQMRGNNLYIRKSDIADVDSQRHVILQGLDLVLGAMNSRLNDKLKEKPPGSRVRGKRTRAKEKLYKAINKEIRAIYPNFNVGVSTGLANGPTDRWKHPYRHWCFASRGHVVDRSLSKKANGK